MNNSAHQDDNQYILKLYMLQSGSYIYLAVLLIIPSKHASLAVFSPLDIWVTLHFIRTFLLSQIGEVANLIMTCIAMYS